MGWLTKLFGQQTKTAPATKPKIKEQPLPKVKKQPGASATVDLVQEGSFDFEIVGESNYQAELRRLAGPEQNNSHEHVVEVLLICESNNKHDRNAVAVTMHGVTVGYLSRQDAKEYRSDLKDLTGGLPSARTKGMIVGGGIKKRTGERMLLGIKLDLTIPPEVE